MACLLQMMEKSAEPVTPMSFLLRLRSLYPQFAQQQPPNSGEYMQQDAEECWTQLLYTLKETLQVRRCTWKTYTRNNAPTESSMRRPGTGNLDLH